MKNRIYLFIYFLFGVFSISFCQIIHFQIMPKITDQSIDFDIHGNDTLKHQIFIDPSSTQKNKLMVFLPGTGARPAEHYTKFCETAAEQGYIAIGLVYKNQVSVSDSCGTSATSLSNDWNTCSENLRMEIIY